MATFGNFSQLDPEVADVARELICAPVGQRPAFMAFMYVWMGFNGWMEAVTESDFDSGMISELADSPRLTNAYQAAMQHQEFRNAVRAFSRAWPVLNVKDVRKRLGRDAFARMSRDQLIEECQRQDVRFHPPGWNVGDDPTWPQVLKTIYAVRCNLFHGAKSPQNARDRELVRRANSILRQFIDHSGCLDWRD
jgi:hypothetical protein